MKRACIAVFTNEYENNIIFLFTYILETDGMRVPSDRYKNDFSHLGRNDIAINLLTFLYPFLQEI